MLSHEPITVICESKEESAMLQRKLFAIGVVWVGSGEKILRYTAFTIQFTGRTNMVITTDSVKRSMMYQEYIDEYLTPQSNTNKMLKALKCTK